MDASPQSNQKKHTGKIGRAVSFVFYPKYLSPSSWFRHPAYSPDGKSARFQRGNVLKTAWGNFTGVWHVGSRKVRKETFSEAIERLNLSDDDLRQRYRDFVRGSRICFFMALLVLIFSLIHALHGNWAGGIAGIFMGAAAIQSGLLRSHRAWQIESRTLTTYRAFLATPEAWFI